MYSHKRKIKKFRPKKTPRYLPGSVMKTILLSDLEEYNKHLYNIYTAAPRVDSKPPKMSPYKYLNKQRIMDDARRVRALDMENKQLVKKIQFVRMKGGRVDTYNPEAYAYMSRWKDHHAKMKNIELENKNVFRLIKNAISEYRQKEMIEFFHKHLEKKKYFAKYPFKLLQKPSLDEELRALATISGNLPKLCERPLCFLEFKVANGDFLGRIVIELYHDHVPVTVQNFLEICRGDHNLSYKGCVLHRIIPGEFFETGDITKGTGRGGRSIYGEVFDEERHVLKHTKAGVLSMKRIGTQQYNNSQFCITLSKMEKFDKKHVVFGKIIKGAQTIIKIQGYGRKIGKPLATVFISNCGEYKDKA